jgi:hypothetical protein
VTRTVRTPPATPNGEHAGRVPAVDATRNGYRIIKYV